MRRQRYFYASKVHTHIDSYCRTKTEIEEEITIKETHKTTIKFVDKETEVVDSKTKLREELELMLLEDKVKDQSTIELH